MIQGVGVRRYAHRWRTARLARGGAHSFEPPFFEHLHDATGTSSALLLLFHLLGAGGGNQALLDVASPLLVLEVNTRKKTHTRTRVLP